MRLPFKESHQILLDIPFSSPYGEGVIQVLIKSLIGNPVLTGDGPAAVIGDENRPMPLSVENGWEGAESRMIRESEDLPGLLGDISAD